MKKRPKKLDLTNSSKPGLIVDNLSGSGQTVELLKYEQILILGVYFDKVESFIQNNSFVQSWQIIIVYI